MIPSVSTTDNNNEFYKSNTQFGLKKDYVTIYYKPSSDSNIERMSVYALSYGGITHVLTYTQKQFSPIPIITHGLSTVDPSVLIEKYYQFEKQKIEQ